MYSLTALSPTLRQFLKSILEEESKSLQYIIKEMTDYLADPDNKDENGKIHYDAKKYSEKQFSNEISKLYEQRQEILSVLQLIKKKK